MNLSEFKANDALSVGWKNELQQNQLLKTAIEAVNTDSPLNGVTTETDPLICLGEIRGYERALKNIFDLANLTKSYQPLQSSYGVTPDASRS
jgi:hypothetical protein